MGREFGKLAHGNRLVYFGISSFEQKLRPKFKFGNFFRRWRHNILVMSPAFITGYTIFWYIEKEHDQSIRKNPADYVNDK